MSNGRIVKMGRTYVAEIATATGLHHNTIRRWVDRGYIECKRDLHGWRWFPDPKETIKRIEGLLDGDIKLEG